MGLRTLKHISALFGLRAQEIVVARNYANTCNAQMPQESQEEKEARTDKVLFDAV